MCERESSLRLSDEDADGLQRHVAQVGGDDGGLWSGLSGDKRSLKLSLVEMLECRYKIPHRKHAKMNFAKKIFFIGIDLPFKVVFS